MNEYEPGRAQKSFDKQFVREYLESIGWDKKPPAPTLPDDVVKNTELKYIEASIYMFFSLILFPFQPFPADEWALNL